MHQHTYIGKKNNNNNDNNNNNKSKNNTTAGQNIWSGAFVKNQIIGNCKTISVKLFSKIQKQFALMVV